MKVTMQHQGGGRRDGFRLGRQGFRGGRQGRGGGGQAAVPTPVSERMVDLVRQIEQF